MRVGVTTIFDGREGRQLDFIQSAAVAAENLGYSTFWAPEHVAFFDEYTSTYPHSKSGRFGFLPDQGCMDALQVLSVAAQATTTIQLGTTVEIVPLRNPVVRARELASLDVLSGGRFVYGVGVGWLKEEYEACGVPFETRGEVANEYLGAMKVLWSDRRSTYHGTHVNFDDVICFPKPIRQPGPPILVGGITRAAIRRAVRLGEGWYGWRLTLDELDAKLVVLDEELAAAGRSRDGFRIQLGGPHAGVEDLADYLAALESRGVEEYTLGLSLPRETMHEQLEGYAIQLGLAPAVPV